MQSSILNILALTILTTICLKVWGINGLGIVAAVWLLMPYLRP
jgi:hypothetical protein